MSEKDFDRGYKSGFKFGKEVANEEWTNKVKQARKEIENLNIYVIEDIPNNIFVSGDDVLAILDRLISEVG